MIEIFHKFLHQITVFGNLLSQSLNLILLINLRVQTKQ